MCVVLSVGLPTCAQRAGAKIIFRKAPAAENDDDIDQSRTHDLIKKAHLIIKNQVISLLKVSE